MIRWTMENLWDSQDRKRSHQQVQTLPHTIVTSSTFCFSLWVTGSHLGSPAALIKQHVLHPKVTPHLQSNRNKRHQSLPWSHLLQHSRMQHWSFSLNLLGLCLAEWTNPVNHFWSQGSSRQTSRWFLLERLYSHFKTCSDWTYSIWQDLQIVPKKKMSLVCKVHHI